MTILLLFPVVFLTAIHILMYTLILVQNHYLCKLYKFRPTVTGNFQHQQFLVPSLKKV